MMTPAKSKVEHKMPLSDAATGKTVRVVSIDAGHSLKNRLAALGVLTNAAIHIIRNGGAGQLVVAIKNSKIVLGRGASQKIFVADM